MTPCRWMPATAGPASSAPRYGSSPLRLSKTRPLSGTRATLRPGPSAMFVPDCRNSRPRASAQLETACLSQVAARARALGHAVEVPTRATRAVANVSATSPCGPSESVSPGMWCRLTPHTLPMCRPVTHEPWSRPSCSVRVRFPTIAAAVSALGSGDASRVMPATRARLSARTSRPCFALGSLMRPEFGEGKARGPPKRSFHVVTISL
eukprot:scaffold113701_cov66-Phaeocystis_antarctica.AAC.6